MKRRNVVLLTKRTKYVKTLIELNKKKRYQWCKYAGPHPKVFTLFSKILHLWKCAMVFANQYHHRLTPCPIWVFLFTPLNAIKMLIDTITCNTCMFMQKTQKAD